MRKIFECCRCPHWLVAKLTTPTYQQIKAAIWHQQIDLLKQLLKKGAPLHDKCETILHFAIENNKPEVVSFLCKNFEELLEQRNQNGDTPLLLALFHGNIAIISHLITKTKLNVKDNFGNNALIIATANNQIMIVQKLLESISPLIRNYEGQTALHRACYYGHLDIIKLLLENTNLKFYQVDNNNNNSLHLACQGCSIICIKYMINKVENPTILLRQENKEGKKPLQILEEMIKKLNQFSKQQGFDLKQIYQYIFEGQSKEVANC